MKHLFVILFVGLLVRSVWAQDTTVVERYDYWLLQYAEGEWTPALDLNELKVAGFFLPCHQNHPLSFCSTTPLTIWVDGQFLSNKSGEEPCVWVPARDFCLRTNADTAFVVVSGQRNLESLKISALKIYQKPSEEIWTLRNRPSEQQFTRAGFIIIFSMLLLIRPFNPFKNWRPGSRAAFEDYRFLSWDFILPLFIFLSIVSFCWSLTASSDKIGATAYSLMALLAFIVIKATWVYLTASIFRMTDKANWQLIVFTRILGVAAIFVLIVSLLDALYFDYKIINGIWMKVVFLITILITLFAHIYTFISQTSMKTLHLFIYLCSTEFLPSALVASWFLK